jgi:hypothetical protein
VHRELLAVSEQKKRLESDFNNLLEHNASLERVRRQQ